MNVWVCHHFVSFEGEIGQIRVFDNESKARAWVAEFEATRNEWRECEECEVK